MTEILHKMQFRFNQVQLEELDDEMLDDDVSSNLQQYFYIAYP